MRPAKEGEVLMHIHLRAEGARRAVRRTTALVAGALVAPAALAVPAMAAEPPALGHEVISFPSRDFVSATGYTKDVPAIVQVRRRNPATGLLEEVSRSTRILPQDDPSTPGFDGLVEVNHPGGGCWQNVTPDIRPGDKVRVFQRADDPTTDVFDPIFVSDDQTTTAYVRTNRPQRVGTSLTVTMTGTAQRFDAAGRPLAAQVPLAQLEARLISGKDRFATNGRRDLRAPGNGTIRYTVPGSTTDFTWTATFTLKTADDVTRALAAEARILWLGRTPANGNELTIMENHPDIVNGPEPPCTAPLEGAAPAEPVAPKRPAPDTVPAFTTLLAQPALGHTVIPFPSRDFVSAEGYRPGVPATVNVFRPDAAGVRTLVGSATVTPGDDGLVEINHPGGGCWIDQTPNIRAGDIVRVTQQAADGSIVAEETTVANVVAKRARTTTVSGQVIVTGTASTAGTEAAPAGDRIPLAQLEQRLVNPSLFAKNGRRTLRAPGDGTLAYVGATGYTWRATYNGLSSGDITKALAAESRILWLGSDPALENQLTIFEIGDEVQNGPEPPCTAPAEAA
jgi:hypothetical protein